MVYWIENLEGKHNLHTNCSVDSFINEINFRYMSRDELPFQIYGHCILSIALLCIVVPFQNRKGYS